MTNKIWHNDFIFSFLILKNIYSTRNVEGIPVCNSSLKIKDITENYRGYYNTLYIDPTKAIINGLHLYFTENCPG